MKKFRVEISERLATFIEIEAETEEEAKDKAEEMYYNEEIVLDSSNHIDTEIEVIKEVKEK